MSRHRLERRIRALLTFFIVCLVFSGLTAFPLNAELDILSRMLGIDATVSPEEYSGLSYWIAKVAQGLRETDARYLAGMMREIPLYWRLIDCSFGVFGFITLWLCRRDIVSLESLG